MKLQKVVWFEGMKLDPHHFQQADRYNQYYINKRINGINPNYWGFGDFQIDEAALAGGSFGLISCSGIMPDGLPFEMPANEQLPKSRSFEESFPATSEKLEVYLAIPIENLSGNNCKMNGSQNPDNSRFTLQNVDFLDYNSGTNLRSIGIVRPNFQLKFGGESLDDFSSLKLGEILRSSDGKFYMNKKFICPMLNITGPLSDYASEILGLLISKSKELKNQSLIRKPELSLNQVEILMMFQSVNTFIPLLNYYHHAKHIHPENLYILFLNIAGHLSGYSSTGSKITELPAYDHKHLTEIFSQATDEIKIMLNVQKTIERRDLAIPLRKHSDTLFVGQLSPEHLSAQFYIAVQGDLPEKKIITELPKNIKISAYEEIFAVHQAGIQGVSIEYAARPAPGITINEKAHYFKINKEGRFWDKIASKNNIAFFIASEFKSLNIELVLLLPGV
ncbi:MAG TPA: type VI secretion system baseplate subunit TssK [Ignavibacteriaceae bacterium]|nr:type VI secretion system baseplate subunit TssK [Ignavibacteriaceae bacterium]